jgi:hypothetical protein
LLGLRGRRRGCRRRRFEGGGRRFVVEVGEV